MEAQELLKELKRTIDELRAFNEIGKVLTSTLDIHEVLGLIMEQVSAVLQPANWSLLLVDEEKGELVFEVAVGPSAATLKGLRIRIDEGIAGWVAREGRTLLVPDVSSDRRFSARFDEATRFTTQSIVAVPMRSRGRTLGVIELVNGRDQPAFTEKDARTLASIADYAAIAIENARNFQRVQELTVLDEHTGLYNARHLQRVLEQEVTRSKRFGHPLSLIFFDLDRFKSINDTHGHQAGSAILRECGQVMLSALRSVDVGIRYGGDEFVCVLPETSKAQALQMAGKLREALVGHRFLQDRGLGLQVTASFGVATWPDDADNAEDLMKRSDLAMYRVKQTTRDAISAA
ncbi:GGDEF domain-containing protein [Vulgatibacter sp.]|uniref:GGDEF domain-containing protein n=1 Tax=Vulgatibacter sp. TaxID=1971226 RepID=UPI003562E637